MSTQRDELAREIFISDNSHARRAVMEAEWSERSGGYQYAFWIADGLIAAGWTKPRIITTAEELDALPQWSAILDGVGDVAQKLNGRWHFPETAPMGASKVLKYGASVTVLYEPTA